MGGNLILNEVKKRVTEGKWGAKDVDGLIADVREKSEGGVPSVDEQELIATLEELKQKASKSKPHEVAIEMIAECLNAPIGTEKQARFDCLCELLTRSEIVAKDLPSTIEQLKKIGGEMSQTALRNLIKELQERLDAEMVEEAMRRG